MENEESTPIMRQESVQWVESAGSLEVRVLSSLSLVRDDESVRERRRVQRDPFTMLLVLRDEGFTYASSSSLH